MVDLHRRGIKVLRRFELGWSRLSIAMLNRRPNGCVGSFLILMIRLLAQSHLASGQSLPLTSILASISASVPASVHAGADGWPVLG